MSRYETLLSQAMQQLQRQQFFHRLRPLTALVRGRQDLVARGMFETLLTEWTVRNFPTVDCSGFRLIKKYSKLREVQAFVDWLSGLEFLEASFWLSSVYALWAGDIYRKTYAVFFTPPSLTTRLLDDLSEAGVSFTSSTFVDPACGGAAFLAPITQRIRLELKSIGWSAAQILEHVAANVFGADIDERLCVLSRHFMRIVLRDEIFLVGREPAFRISRADSLRELGGTFGTFDVVVCNPPYRKMTSVEVLAVGEGYNNVVQSQPNLYGLFIALCVKLLRFNGHAALVTPTSFLTGKYFSSLRKYLAEEAEVLKIGMVSDRTGVFIDVEQETALTLLKRSPPLLRQPDTTVSLVARDGSYRAVGTCNLSSSGAAWTIPRTEADVGMLERISRSPWRISDYGYRVRIGIFVWNRDQRPTYFNKEAAPQDASSTIFPLVWSSDIGTDLQLKFGTKSNDHVEPAWVKFDNSEHTGVVTRPAVVLQRVTSNDQPKRLVGAIVPMEFIERHGGFVAENHVVVLEQVAPGFSPANLARLLACTTIDRYFRCISGSINVSAYELLHLPLPNPSDFGILPDDSSIDEAVLAAFARMPSSEFVPAAIESHKLSYFDSSIEEGPYGVNEVDLPRKA
jgi:adenine-specific DNA-methyltransferase